MLVLAPAAANGEPAAQASPQEKRASSGKRSVSLSLDQRLDRVQRKARKHRTTVRFYERNGHYLRSGKHAPRAMTRLRTARRELAQATRSERQLRRSVARRNARAQARRLAKAPPKTVICHVFGRRYCRQALAVAWCESRFSTRARNGQYLGLFQMGSYERQRFGHGETAHAQTVAAHRYFVLSGRDWSPWGCKPWYAM